jgi:hypothetical protein
MRDLFRKALRNRGRQIRLDRHHNFPPQFPCKTQPNGYLVKQDPTDDGLLIPECNQMQSLRNRALRASPQTRLAEVSPPKSSHPPKLPSDD